MRSTLRNPGSQKSCMVKCNLFLGFLVSLEINQGAVNANEVIHG